MNVWSNPPTIIKQRYALLTAGLLTLLVALTTTLLFANVSQAAPGINEKMSFQGRLLNSSGGVVPDGRYNMQFKIYQGGSGTTANNTDGSLSWTETYVNNNANEGAVVKNGYFSVDLGSKTPFGSSIDWNDDTLWLSINIAGSAAACTTFGSAPCTADGEMLPMKRLTSTPYALNAGKLGGIGASGFVQNTTSQQTGNFNISGTGVANTLQGNTSIIAPMFDRADAGSLAIGNVNASTIEIGNNNANHTISIATGTGTQAVTLGSVSGSSSSTIQGGSGGVLVKSSGSFAVQSSAFQRNLFQVGSDGSTDIRLNTNSIFSVRDKNDDRLLYVNDNGRTVETGWNSTFIANGDAIFEEGIVIQGTGNYTTPLGSSLSSAITIPNYTVPAYGSIVAFGLPSSSDATARGLLIADARTGSHQATIGVLSPNENSIMGLSWNGSNTKGYLSNTANSLALQGNGLDLLTATNNGGQANVGIGNGATSGYALDVTGVVNSSSQYRVNGQTTLTDSALTFSGAQTSTISGASGQSLDIASDADITIGSYGETKATLGETNIKIGDNTGDTTLLTLDKSATAPTVTDTNAMLGSMYYDSTLGEVQCYEASGWGNCGASPDSFVTLSPEYTNAVMNGADIGTITSDLCSDSLNINDGSSAQPTICGTNETYNFYKWTSAETSAQTRSIYVTYQLPANFKEFVAGSTSLMGRTDSSDSVVTYQVYRDGDSGLVSCGTVIPVSTGAQTAWQNALADSTDDPANCSFEAGESILFRINLTSQDDANAYVSNLNFTFSNN